MTSIQSMVGRIPLLDGNNYATWKVQMQGILHKLRLLCYVNGEQQRPARDEAAVRVWNDKDMDAKSEMLIAMESSQVALVKNFKTSKEVWDFLENTYERKGTRQKAEEFRKLMNMKMDPMQSMNNYICQFFATVSKLREFDAKIDEELLVVLLLDSLPDTYKEVQAAFDAASSYPSLEIVKTRLLEVGDKKREKGDSAFKIQMPRYSKNNYNQSETFTKNKYFPFQCRRCGRKGLKAQNCWTKKKEKLNYGDNNEQGFILQERLKAYEKVNNALERQNTVNWYLDSGATSHMCCSKESFETLTVGNFGYVQLASEESCPIEGIGTVKRTIADDNKPDDIKLYITLYVPKLTVES